MMDEGRLASIPQETRASGTPAVLGRLTPNIYRTEGFADDEAAGEADSC